MTHSSFFLQALFLSDSWNINYVVGFSLTRALYSDPCVVWVGKPPTFLSSTGRQRRARPRRRERRKRHWRTEGKRRTSWISRHPRCPSESVKPALGDPWVPCSDEFVTQDPAQARRSPEMELVTDIMVKCVVFMKNCPGDSLVFQLGFTLGNVNLICHRLWGMVPPSHTSVRCVRGGDPERGHSWLGAGAWNWPPCAFSDGCFLACGVLRFPH